MMLLEAPPRLRRPGVAPLLLLLVVLALLVDGYRSGAKVDPLSLTQGAGRLAEFLAEAVPPT